VGIGELREFERYGSRKYTGKISLVHPEKKKANEKRGYSKKYYLYIVLKSIKIKRPQP
jgi:hypothetical protein